MALDTMEKQPEHEISHAGSSLETASPELQVNSKRERALLRKIDLHLMGPLWVVFVFGFLDRINLGNVAVLGILKELKMNGKDMALGMQIFFVPYIIADIPSNIILKKFSPSTWISILTFFWGVTCMCQGVVKNKAGLVACRFFMGLFEGGFVPGCAYLMSMYYSRRDFQTRFSLLWVAGLVAGAFGGLLAYALYHMHGLGGYSGWRWIFIIEGLLSIVSAIPAKFLIADWPEQARFLNSEEKALLKERNARDLDGCDGARMDRLDGAAWRRIMSDWKIYVGSLIYISITVSGYATSLFIPSIVNSLGYSGIDSQIHSIPIWVVAAVVTLAVSYLTDRMQHRYGFVMFGTVFASIGYVILLCQGPPHQLGGLNVHVRYMAVFFVNTGCYIVQPVAIVWMANNLGGHYKRAIGLAIQIGFGNIGGIIASNIFNSDSAPRYFVGYGVALAMMVLCAIMSTVFAVGVVIENKKRVSGKRDHRLNGDASVVNNLGDDDPRFRFCL
ncbi:putative transmembrane transporter [Aspergillus clavatus NRRL 1]|uniref:Transmembrane transporter, putative n=1 Tax=Aspergillus clavatus (strain ATCC 1007 / CBS 513.65 / DSM 816 / NCTC 3887 / NRRL 1 / QM 1276 / 107) TaxID=344612 RepID=A1C8I4_ASPCL|nr:transmembrane transporter, putative [Aspergillus clavatus NRRL 1]EAW13621.1 transmembrane transporter, putative [Aspergillus clavatus NRRL 1]